MRVERSLFRHARLLNPLSPLNPGSEPGAPCPEGLQPIAVFVVGRLLGGHDDAEIAAFSTGAGYPIAVEDVARIRALVEAQKKDDPAGVRLSSRRSHVVARKEV